MADAKKQRAWGTDTYAKWDNFDDETDATAGELADELKAKMPTRFDLGEGNDLDTGSARVLVSADERRALRRLPQKDTEVWQVVVRELNVWAAAEAQPSTGGGGGSGGATA